MNEQSEETEAVDPWWLAEFCCWTMVVLAPILTWFNGPSVSTDQFVVRTGVFCLALGGGIGLRVANVRRGRGKAEGGRGKAEGGGMRDERGVAPGRVCEMCRGDGFVDRMRGERGEEGEQWQEHDWQEYGDAGVGEEGDGKTQVGRIWWRPWAGRGCAETRGRVDMAWEVKTRGRPWHDA